MNELLSLATLIDPRLVLVGEDGDGYPDNIDLDFCINPLIKEEAIIWKGILNFGNTITVRDCCL